MSSRVGNLTQVGSQTENLIQFWRFLWTSWWLMQDWNETHKILFSSTALFACTKSSNATADHDHIDFRWALCFPGATVFLREKQQTQQNKGWKKGKSHDHLKCGKSHDHLKCGKSNRTCLVQCHILTQASPLYVASAWSMSPGLWCFLSQTILKLTFQSFCIKLYDEYKALWWVYSFHMIRFLLHPPAFALSFVAPRRGPPQPRRVTGGRREWRGGRCGLKQPGFRTKRVVMPQEIQSCFYLFLLGGELNIHEFVLEMVKKTSQNRNSLRSWGLQPGLLQTWSPKPSVSTSFQPVDR